MEVRGGCCGTGRWIIGRLWMGWREGLRTDCGGLTASERGGCGGTSRVGLGRVEGGGKVVNCGGSRMGVGGRNGVSSFRTDSLKF